VGSLVDHAEGVGGFAALLVEAGQDVARLLRVVEEGQGREGLGAGLGGEEVLDSGVGLAAGEAAAAHGFGEAVVVGEEAQDRTCS